MKKFTLRAALGILLGSGLVSGCNNINDEAPSVTPNSPQPGNPIQVADKQPVVARTQGGSPLSEIHTADDVFAYLSKNDEMIRIYDKGLILEILSLGTRVKDQVQAMAEIAAMRDNQSVESFRPPFNLKCLDKLISHRKVVSNLMVGNVIESLILWPNNNGGVANYQLILRFSDPSSKESYSEDRELSVSC